VKKMLETRMDRSKLAGTQAQQPNRLESSARSFMDRTQVEKNAAVN
jgi:hypothetical protein